MTKRADPRTNDLSCRYVNIMMNYPTKRGGIDTFLWYIYHGDAQVYIGKDGEWYLLVPSSCVHLTKGNRCKLEGRQPDYCTQHGHLKATDIHDVAKHVFTNEVELLTYLKERRPKLFARLPDATRAVVGK